MATLNAPRPGEPETPFVFDPPLDPNAIGRIEWRGEDFDEETSAPCITCVQKRPACFCDAYPDAGGIPWPFREGTHRHRTPYPGDGGTLYTKGRPKVGARAGLPPGAL